MDQIKIGRFIAERRKIKNLTQAQLAEELGITDRAISKWENGRSLPDSSIMLELCELLEITVNDLLSGEVVLMDEYNKEMEKKMLELVKEKESADKKLLVIETAMGIVSVTFMLVLCMIAAYAPIEEWLRIVLVVIGVLPALILTPFMIKIEQTAGYYECKECGHRYVPKYKTVFIAMHKGRTRYMKCPVCEKKSWQKKVISKEKNK